MVTLVTLAKRLSLRCQTRRLGFLARMPEVVSPVHNPAGGQGAPSELQILTLRDPDDCG
jgi:hypothetical protein